MEGLQGKCTGSSSAPSTEFGCVVLESPNTPEVLRNNWSALDCQIRVHLKGRFTNIPINLLSGLAPSLSIFMRFHVLCAAQDRRNITRIYYWASQNHKAKDKLLFPWSLDSLNPKTPYSQKAVRFMGALWVVDLITSDNNAQTLENTQTHRNTHMCVLLSSLVKHSGRSESSRHLLFDFTHESCSFLGPDHLPKARRRVIPVTNLIVQVPGFRAQDLCLSLSWGRSQVPNQPPLA